MLDFVAVTDNGVGDSEMSKTILGNFTILIKTTSSIITENSY